MEDSGEEEMTELNEEEEDSNDAIKEIPAKRPRLYQTQNTQLKKLSRGEYSKAQHKIRTQAIDKLVFSTQASPLNTSESCQHNIRTSSDHGQKFDVFLSHSGKQKNFVRQLYRDLTNQGLLCFFDEDRDESLPVGEVFPSRIFEAVQTCKLALFLLSMDFLHSKWPMLELAACVKAGDTSPRRPKIIPLFYIISPGERASLDEKYKLELKDKKWKELKDKKWKELKDIDSLNEKWKLELGIKENQRVEWQNALKAIYPINGLTYEGGDETKFRDEIVKEIWGKLPAASPRYYVPHMQGELRMCQEVAEFFNNVKPTEKGIRIAGLHGIAGQGKTTLGKAFCNFKLKEFEGKVCHLDFSKGDSFGRAKFALHYLIHWPQSRIQNLTEDQAQLELHKRMNGQTVLLVLDNITEKITDEVGDFIEADFGRNSCILLSARSLDSLVKCYKIPPLSCLRVPSLEKDDAIAILVDRRTSAKEPMLGSEDKAFALRCANRCAFQELSGVNGRRFHPLALKAFGRYLSCKYGSNLSKWVTEIDALVDRSLHGLDDVFELLDKAFNDMKPKRRTIFMLLSLYIPPNISPHSVTEWLAISCNADIKFVEEAVEELCKMAFIEEFKPEIRIHDLYFEFAERKAKEMGRWLCCEGDDLRGFISQDNAGFELAKLEGCKHRKQFEIAPKYLENLLMLQLVGVQNVIKLDLGRMDSLRSITLHDCRVLSALEGMENLQNLAWLQIRGLGKALKLPKLSSITGLEYLEIEIGVSQVISQLGDLTSCSRLKEINVSCPSLLEFPLLNGFQYLKKVKFRMCDKVQGALCCTGCEELESIVLENCCTMAAPPLLVGCKKLSEIVMSDCGAVTAFPDIDVPSALKTLQLQISSTASSPPTSLESCYRLENLRLLDIHGELPSFTILSNLTVLEIGECGITEPPLLICCVMLEDVHFYNLKNLRLFPNFSLLRKLKKLNLCNCSSVRDPPNISGCHQLQLFYLQHNKNMKGLSKMDECAQLEEVKVSWQCEDDDEVSYKRIDPYSCKVDDDLEACLDCFKDVILENLNGVSVPVELEQWMRGKTMMAKKYIRGLKLCYSVTAPYDSGTSSRRFKSRNPITLKSVGSTVLAYSALNSVHGDYGWLNRVRKYYGGRYIAPARAASGINVDTSLSPNYHFQKLKTTIAKAFRKVWHPKFCGGASPRQKHALHSLSQFRNLNFKWETSDESASSFFKSSMDGKRVLLVVDNISENSIDEVKCYAGPAGEMSCILWTARSVDALDNSNVNKWLEEEEVIAILVERTFVERTFTWGRPFSLWCANRCSFEEDTHSSDLSYRLATINRYKDIYGRRGIYAGPYGRYFTRVDTVYRVHHLDAVFAVLQDAFESFQDVPRFQAMYFHHLEKWLAEINCVEDMFVGLCWLAIKWELENSNALRSSTGEVAIEFEKEIEDIKAGTSPDEVVKWLLMNCKEEIKEKVEYIKCIISKKEIKEIKEEVGRIHRGLVRSENMRIKEEVWKIAENISFLLQRSPRMEGGIRMCQEVADFLKTVHPNEKGIRFAGIYGIAGLGKTTLAKAFCDHEMLDFAGKVCVVQFCDGNALNRQKLALQYLFQFPMWELESLTSIDDAQYSFYTLVKGQRLLLVLDNITEDSIDEVRHYLGAELGTESCILLISQSVDVLKKFNIDSRSSMHVPMLQEEEALAILLGEMSIEKSVLGADHRGYALQCANRCSFKKGRDSAPTFHPLALKAFGRHLFRKHGSDFSKWVDGFPNEARGGVEGIFDVLEKAFDDMGPRYRRIFMFLARHMPQNKPSDTVTKWVAINCNEELTYIKETVKDLCEKAFIEKIEPEFRIHDFIKEFLHIKQYNFYDVDEAKFSDEIVRGISRLIPQKYHVPAMQGEARICQEVVSFFNTVHPNEKKICSAGLYGMPGMGKTTMAKAFCNLNFKNFDGKVYHLEFASRGHSMESKKFKLLRESLHGQRVLLVLDNIQTKESIDGVRDFLRADLGENSWILLIARCVDVLKNFIEIQSCKKVPGLEEKEAIAVLLESTSLAESALEAENRGFALQCAKKCSFKEISCAHTFVPLVLKTFGRHLFSKYGSDLSKWVLELDGLVIGSDDGLGDMFAVLDKIFEEKDTRYHTMFMLLTVYMPRNMPPNKVTEWLAINCKEEIDFIEKAVEDLWQMAFIEEINPQIRIHDLHMEFAQSKARQMERWLCCNRDLLTPEAEGWLFSEDKNGFELAKLEYWQHQDLCQIGNRFTENLWALQVACNEISNLGLSSMKNIRSLTLHYCTNLEVIQGIEILGDLAWLQIEEVPKLKVLNISSLAALKYLEINTGGLTELGDLTCCVSLIEIYIRCPSLWEFPRIDGLPDLEKASFKSCGEVIGPLDCTACVKLQSIALEKCWQMAHIPLVDGCSNISKIVLNRCDQLTDCSDGDESSPLEIVKLCVSSDDASVPRHSECCDGPKNILLWNIVVSMDVPSLRRFSNLTVLNLYNCDICEPPDIAGCRRLQDVCFSTLKNLESFPTFSSLRELKKLCLCNCPKVRAPPDIGGCYELQVFHLLYNDNMERLPKMDGWQPFLEEIKMSWQSEEVFDYPDSYKDEDLEFCLDLYQDAIFRKINDVIVPVELKKWQWIRYERVKVQQYFRGKKVYYSIACSRERNTGRGARKQACNGDPVEHVISHRASRISDEDELRFREKVVKAIGRLIPPRIRFPYSSMQKATTLNWLEKASTIKGLHIANLYEVAGNEKTVLRQSFYNFGLKGFEDEVSTLEFLEGNSLERLNNALLYLTCPPAPTTGEISSVEDAFSRGPTFNIMILLIRYTIPDRFMDNNLMDIARDFHRNWGGNTRMVFHSQMYTIIELSRA